MCVRVGTHTHITHTHTHAFSACVAEKANVTQTLSCTRKIWDTLPKHWGYDELAAGQWPCCVLGVSECKEMCLWQTARVIQRRREGWREREIPTLRAQVVYVLLVVTGRPVDVGRRRVMRRRDLAEEGREG